MASESLKWSCLGYLLYYLNGAFATIGALQTLVIDYFHCIETSMQILLNIAFLCLMKKVWMIWWLCITYFIMSGRDKSDNRTSAEVSDRESCVKGEKIKLSKAVYHQFL